MRNRTSSVLRSILKTAVCYLDQTGEAADEVRERVVSGIDRASDRVADIRDRAHDLVAGEDHTLRSALMFAAGVGIGVTAGMLLAPASGEDTRNSINDKVQEFRGQVRDRFGRAASSVTGTEGP